MSECRDPRFEKMLHAYELGMLSGDDRESFEVHLYECDSCFARAEKFREAAGSLKHSPDVRTEIARLAQGESVADLPARRSWLARLAPTSVLAILALLILLFKPWEIVIRPTLEAQAVENRLMVMPFENAVDPSDSDRLGAVIAELLITDLSESRYVQVVSGQRRDDVKALIRAGDSALTDGELNARTVSKARAQWLVSGTVAQSEPELVVTAQLIDAATGDVVAASRFAGGSDVFVAVDSLSRAIKGGLTLPEAAMLEPDRAVVEIATDSPEAYVHYLNGVEAFARRQWIEGERHFEAALRDDSLMAMAYYYLALSKDPSMLGRAVELIDRANQRDQYYIRATKASRDGRTEDAVAELHAALERFPDEKRALYNLGIYSYRLGRADEAIMYFDSALTVDPRYRQALNVLARVADYTGDYERAVVALDRYIKLAPDEAGPYDARATIHARRGEMDKALVAYQQALERKPDFYSSLCRLGCMYVHAGEYERADSAFSSLIANNPQRDRSIAQTCLAAVEAKRGRLHSAIGILDDGLAADLVDSTTPRQSVYPHFKYLMKTRLLLELGETDSALTALDRFTEIAQADCSTSQACERDVVAELLAQAGRLDEADSVAATLGADLEAAGSELAAWNYARGAIAFYSGEYAAAIEALKPTEASAFFGADLLLARAYLETERWDEAVATLEGQLTNYDHRRVYRPVWFSKLPYYLGRAYEGSRWNDRAITQYREFLDGLSEADFELSELADARARLARMTAGS